MNNYDLPWTCHTEEVHNLFGPNSHVVCITTQDKSEKIVLLGAGKQQKAKFIVAACNAHEKLVEAARDAITILIAYQGRLKSPGCAETLERLQQAVAAAEVRHDS